MPQEPQPSAVPGRQIIGLCPVAAQPVASEEPDDVANLRQATTETLVRLYDKYSHGLEQVEAELRARRWCPPARPARVPDAPASVRGRGSFQL